MDERPDQESEKNAITNLFNNVLPNRKYGQNLRTNTGTHIKRHQIRKHSLDDETFAKGIDRYNDSASTEDEFYSFANATEAPGRDRYDYNWSKSIECSDGTQQLSLPEFVGKGGSIGIFKVPNRSAVHPGRPTCIELRPHPLRETQVGKYLKTIACTETQLWAGQESGVRVWNFVDSYEAGAGVGGKIKRGDEDAAPFHESANTSPTMCMLVDGANKLVWTGHKDGRVRSWRTDQPIDNTIPFKEGLSWQANRGPVVSLAFSAYGDLWSGFEGGVIKIWPWEAIAKSLALSSEERHMAALLVERSFVDLRNQVTVNGVCSISSTDVKCLLSDNIRRKMWAAGSFSFSLWDARTRELLKVYNLDGQLENRVDMLSALDQVVEEELNIKFAIKSSSKKEKPQAGNNFLQRSRNAIMGAADAVRRAASKSTVAFQEDVKKTEALVLSGDGMIWSGCSNGLLVQWDGNGNRLQEFLHHPSSVLCFCSYGSRLWVGYMSGMVHILDLEGNLIAGWFSHNSPIITLVVGNGNIFSLATHGGIRGWNLASPGPLDKILRPKLAEKELLYTGKETMKILVGTWNVSQGKPSQEALRTWLGTSVSDVGILVVGLQEVEMGAGFLAMSAAKETVGLEGSSIGQWWQDAIGKSLDEGSTFERVGSRQLGALLIAVWVRRSLRTHVGDLDVGAVACGLGRAIGNKGGVGLRLRVYGRIICFVNCHFAAHLEAVNRRNADFDHIYRTMAFTKLTNLLTNPSAGVQTAAQMLRGTTSAGGNSDQEAKLDLAEADMVIFCGDFNYRLFGITYDEARDFVSQRSFDWLRERDQLRGEMKAGKVFQGFREALIRFPPTYKFEIGKPGLGGYDSGEKKRIPAWCDRILYRDNRSTPTTECSLECPVVSSILTYEACMEVLESDHKPVRCKFHVEISHVDRSVRRQVLGNIYQSNDKVKALLDELRYVPETEVSTDRIVLQDEDTCSLRITNKSVKDNVVYQIICGGQCTINEDEQPSDFRPKGCFAFPRWLEVTPSAGVIKEDETAEIMVHHEDWSGESGQAVPPTWWLEDTRNKEVLLVVIIRGNSSTETTTHHVYVRHSLSEAKIAVARTATADSTKGGAGGSSMRNKSHAASRGPGGHRHSYSSSDIIDDSRRL